MATLSCTLLAMKYKNIVDLKFKNGGWTKGRMEALGEWPLRRWWKYRISKKLYKEEISLEDFEKI